MKEAWAELRIAGAFLTIFPVARGVDMPPARLTRSMGLFPAVGLLLGLGLVLCNGLLALLLPRAVVDALLLVLLIWSSGALHLDGVADTLDGLAGGRDRESSLRIMKDSRIGAIGAVGLVLVVLLKYLSLNSLPLELKGAALILMPAAGRWCQVFLASCSTYLRGKGTGAVFVDQVGQAELLRASLTLLLAALVLFQLKGLLLALLLVLFAGLLLHWFEKRLGGVSGDLLGAATELIEIFFLLTVLIIS